MRGAGSVLKRLVATPPGRMLFQTVRPALHYARRRAHPDLPAEHKITTVKYGERVVKLRHRRWSLSDALAIRQCFAEAQYDLPNGVHGAAIARIYEEIMEAGADAADCGLRGEYWCERELVCTAVSGGARGGD